MQQFYPWMWEPGAQGHVPPLFEDSGKVPLLYKLACLLENFENANINRKINRTSEFR